MVVLGLFATSCNDHNNDPMSPLMLNITGLEDLGADFRYEGWLIVNGAPVSTGTFSVNSSGTPSSTSFSMLTANLTGATKFVLTIEPYPDSDPTPSATHLLAGDFTGTTAPLSIGAPEALNNDFTAATGKYILATPSNGDNTDENSGIWFLGSLPPTAGLVLPTLPAGWKYEGWAVIGGTPVTSGTFLTPMGADEFNGFSGPSATPPFPGEDFLVNAPTGVTFPTDLSGGKVVVSIEPFPDNSPAPFLLKPLLADVPAGAMDHVVYNMNNIIASNAPTGTATR